MGVWKKDEEKLYGMPDDVHTHTHTHSWPSAHFGLKSVISINITKLLHDLYPVARL